jgi:hypothetical protein
MYERLLIVVRNELTCKRLLISVVQTPSGTPETLPLSITSFKREHFILRGYACRRCIVLDDGVECRSDVHQTSVHNLTPHLHLSISRRATSVQLCIDDGHVSAQALLILGIGHS